MPRKSVVSVNISKQDGWYIATSQDLDGLMVCHQNFVKFASEIPACIKALFQADYNMDVDVEELPSLGGHDVSRVVFEASIKKAA